MKQVPTGLFKPNSTRTEAKADTTDKAARQIIDAEAAKRAAKTEKLRAARLAQEADAPAPAPTKARRKA